MKTTIIVRLAALIVSLAAGAYTATTAFAQIHAGDIEIGVSAGKLTTSRQVFESDFLPFGSLLFTDEPGFDSQIGTFSAGDQVGFNITRQLYFWDGMQLSNSPAGDASLNIDFFGQPTVSVDTMDSFVSGFNFPAVAPGDNGVIHRHLDFSLPSSAPAGAYGLVFELASADYATSDEFLIVFNNDLSGPQFEAGVGAISQAAFAVVPEPDAIMLWAAGTSVLLAGYWWRRRRNCCSQSIRARTRDLLRAMPRPGSH